MSMIAHGFARRGFFVGLLVGHSTDDSLENLLLRETGILQPADFRGAHRWKALQMALNDGLDRRLGKPDQPNHDGIATDGIKLISPGKFQNLGIPISGTGQTDYGIRASERLLVRMRRRNQCDARFVAHAGVFEFYDLGDFQVRSVENFESLDYIGPHTSLDERAVIRKRMLVTPAGKKKANREKQNARFHTFILSTATLGAPGVCFG